jgi:hypothetical protein
MQDFLKKLYDTNSTLSLLLLEGRDIAEKHEDFKLINYIDNELNGYKIEEGLPEYRKIKGQIVGDIKDVYGNLLHKEYPLDFSALSEKIGFDLDDAYIPDSVAFVETSLRGLTGKNAIKPMPRELVKTLDETFHYNNPRLHLISAYHKIPTPSLEYILIKVRQNLIHDFQILNRRIVKATEELEIKIVANSEINTNPKKKVFVSYAWEDEKFNSKIISFVEFLRTKGFDASMDKKRNQEEVSINFNQMMIDGIQNSDKVIVVLSKTYKKKADKFEGGVWTEFKIILEDMKKNSNKYIFVYFGDLPRENVTPTAILGTDILNLKKDQDEHKFNTLFSKIKEENIIQFSDVSEQEIEIKKINIEPFEL